LFFLTFQLSNLKKPRKRKSLEITIILILILQRNLKKISEFKLEEPFQQIYFEFIGSGLGLSLNYDRRFKHGKTGLGFRIGSSVTFGYPVSAATDYIIGNNYKSSFLELGIGSTYYFTDSPGL
jgi:hypothetical protein